MQHNERKTSPAALERADEAAVAQAANVAKYISATSGLYPPLELRRGVSVASTLTSFDSLSSCHSTNIFATQPDKLALQDRERLFHRSRPVCAIDCFVSHAWRSEGSRKWMALALHEAGLVPLAVALLACLAMGLIQRSVKLPGNVRLVAENRIAFYVSPYEYTAGLLAAVASIFLLLAMQRTRTYFVDAACIHQTNRALKTQGIRHLAGYVAMSSKLLVLWDENYFNRLWCVYELAMFQAIHPNRPVFFLPLQIALRTCVAIAGTAVAFGFTVLCEMLFFGRVESQHGERVFLADGWLWTPHHAVQLSLSFAFLVMFFLTATVFGADMALQRLALQKHLDSFDVRGADCYSAADRDEIYTAIGSIYARRGVDGLCAFNQLVRTTLKEQVMQRLDHGAALPYSTLLQLLIPVFCFVFGTVYSGMRATSPFNQVLLTVLLPPLMFAACPYFTAVGLDRGARLARSSNQTDLSAFASRARLAIACAAVRGAFESLVFALVPFLCFIFAVEFPEAVGLARVPQRVQHAFVLMLACPWSIAFIYTARRKFGPQATSEAGVDEGRQAWGRRSCVWALRCITAVALVALLSVAAICIAAAANRSSAAPFSHVDPTTTFPPPQYVRALSPSQLYTDFSGRWSLTSTEGDMDAMLHHLGSSLGLGGVATWSLQTTAAAFNYLVGLAEVAVTNLARDHADVEANAASLLHTSRQLYIDGRLHTSVGSNPLGRFSYWAEWANTTFVMHVVAPMNFTLTTLLLPDGRMRLETTRGDLAFLFTRIGGVAPSMPRPPQPPPPPPRTPSTWVGAAFAEAAAAAASAAAAAASALGVIPVPDRVADESRR